MDTRYYLSEAFDVDGYGQSDELYLMELNNRVIGYSSEFDVCTFDIEKACSLEKHREVEWFDPEKSWIFKPASFETLKNLNLTSYLIGSRQHVNTNEPIEPITDLDATN
jgi:hypothetical protein